MELAVSLLLSKLLLALLGITEAQALSWGGAKGGKSISTKPIASKYAVPQASDVESSLPKLFAVALSDLQELESQPLCHRIAARLLVNNCQLLEGQNDATVLTDSGRATRDFVDSYAASLAICDLERGSFKIPAACSKFEESVLAKLSPSPKPQLHVTTAEIDSCLEGLAQSDSAWNTWISYRHKTLRFCEAARVDNEKDENIRLHQRITKILARLTTQLEEEMDGHLQSLNRVFQDASMAVDSLMPQIDSITDGLVELDGVLRDRITKNAEKSAVFVERGIADARQLQELLAMLIHTVRGQSDDITTSHHTALQVSTEKITSELELILSAIATAAVSSTSLHQEIEKSKTWTEEVYRRQQGIEEGMRRLENLADNLLFQQQGHQEQLDQASQTTATLIGIIDSASSSAESLRSSISGGFGWGNWWPYIFCPITSIVVGSYGLPPSTMRNFLLLSLGEAAGLAVSVARTYGHDIFTAFTDFNVVDTQFESNSTNPEGSVHSKSGATNGHVLEQAKVLRENS